MHDLTEEEIQQAKATGVLDLSNRGLTALPLTVTELTGLVELRLRGNRLATLAPEVGRLTDLRILDVSANQLTDLPASIGALTNLETLSLGDNQLTGLPDAIATLTSLRTLNLGNNQLTALPAAIGALASLRTLHARANRLTTVPPAIGRLANLQTLRLSRNEIALLPEEIGRLDRLESLHLAGNQLTGVPEAIAHLHGLQTLDLRANQLTALPAAVGLLPKLQLLNLSGNRLRRLPAELADLLDDGLELRIDGNPLEESFRAMVERGQHALAEYMRSLADGVPQFEAKVLIVGEGTVGKTSLIAALRGEPFVGTRETTHGTEINELRLPHPSLDETLTLRAWDFGGQEVYRVTHQFFFTARALYLVVWHPRQGQEQNEVEGWLRRIRLRVGSDVGVLVVSTHADDGRRAELDYGRLERMFPGMLRGQYAVDSRTGTGIDRLKRAIAEHAAALPFMGEPMHVEWAAARDAIMSRARAEPHIPYDEFERTCAENGVEADHAALLSRIMAERGQIVHYGDDDGLADVVVLNPELLTKAISYVLEDGPTGDSGGILQHARLAQLWRTPGYARGLHPYLLRLMEKFDISFRLPGTPHRSLVAQLVPFDRPGLPWLPGGALPAGQRALRLVVRLAEPAPPGVIAWLTVRHHTDSTGRSWRSGVHLRHHIDVYDSEALLELASDTELVLEVRAPAPDLYFHELRGSIEFLLRDRWPGLGYELLVPCPTRDADGRACDGVFRLAALHRYREKRRATITCDECLDDHNVQALLTGHSGQPTTAAGARPAVADPAPAGAPSDRALMMRLMLQAAQWASRPRLFTLTEEVTPLPVRAMGKRRMKLTLWCEHPGAEHPGAVYEFDTTKQFVAKASPYLGRALQVLQLVGAFTGVPVPDLGLLTTPSDDNSRRDSIARAVPQYGEPGLTESEYEGLREVRSLLHQLDPGGTFGGLQPMPDPSGQLFWVCPDHRKLYDPGLPVVP